MKVITDKEIKFLRIDKTTQRYLLNKLIETEEDKYTILLTTLNNEGSFMYKHSLFYKDIESLLTDLGLKMSKAEINVLQDIFAICHNRHSLLESKLFCLKDKTIEALARHFKSEYSFVDSHIATRHDISLFKVLYLILEYSDYKEIVFKHCCKTIRCCRKGVMGCEHDPFYKVKDNFNLKEKDYAELCKSVWCNG
jgi:sRNA-binding regulator protein Hfq